jgi:AraC family transcriptional regulator of adaptative response/methylated-DNA-[protein]-cysteine methyltransferase
MSQHLSFTICQSTLGSILVAQSEHGICAILLGSDPDDLVSDLHQRFPRATLTRSDFAMERVAREVTTGVESPGFPIRVSLDLGGTPFKQRVWQALRQIPVGTTVSYTEVATRIGAQDAIRAVATACAANPLAVAIPCHRVVRKDGSLSGYRWGVERKRELLLRESVS